MKNTEAQQGACVTESREDTGHFINFGGVQVSLIASPTRPSAQVRSSPCACAVPDQALKGQAPACTLQRPKPPGDKGVSMTSPRSAQPSVQARPGQGGSKEPGEEDTLLDMDAIGRRAPLDLRRAHSTAQARALYPRRCTAAQSGRLVVKVTLHKPPPCRQPTPSSPRTCHAVS